MHDQWMLDGDYILGADDTLVAHVNTHGVNAEEAAKRKAVIATAPEVLDALRRLVELLARPDVKVETDALRSVSLAAAKADAATALRRAGVIQ